MPSKLPVERIKKLEAHLQALKQRVKTYSDDMHKLKQQVHQLYETGVKTNDAEKIKNLRNKLSKNTR